MNFYVIWINLLLMKHNLINLDWIVNNLIVHNLLVNFLKSCSAAVLKNQKQLLADVFLNRCS